MGLSLTRYGGSIAMSPEGASVLTVGSLIKYQLYWNMINNAYQSLNNVLNQFTRAAGAAERVLSLLDMEPDIDPGVEPISVNGDTPSSTSEHSRRIGFAGVTPVSSRIAKHPPP